MWYNITNMYSDNDKIMPGERIGEKVKSKQNSEQAEYWEEEMKNGAPEFAGDEFGYKTPQEFTDMEDNLNPYFNSELPDQPELRPNNALSDAAQLVGYGFDTASRTYGLESVIDAIVETDETQHYQNPLGAIYERIAPDPQERVYLFREIRKDEILNNQYNNDPNLNSEHPRLGITLSGEFYDKTSRTADHEQTSVDAIRALRKLMTTLQTGEKFEELRQRADDEQKSIISYLVSDQPNPTLTDLLNRVGTEMSESDIEEFVEEVIEQKDEQKGESENPPLDKVPESFDDSLSNPATQSFTVGETINQN